MRICQHGDEHSAWSVAHWLFTPAIGRRAQYLQGSLPSLLATGSLSNSVRTELVFDIGKTIRRASETFERSQVLAGKEPHEIGRRVDGRPVD